jgi:hypothetical protein
MTVEVQIDNPKALLEDIRALAAVDLSCLDIVMGENLARLKRIAEFAARSVQPGLLLEKARDSLETWMTAEVYPAWAWSVLATRDGLLVCVGGQLHGDVPPEWEGFPVSMASVPGWVGG